jgi:VanZ family protein
MVLLAAGLLLAVAPLADIRVPLMTDKLLHLAGFTGLTVWFFGIFRTDLSVQVALTLFAYGLLIELLQSFTATRFADPRDVMFNVAGIGAGWLLAAAGLRGWCRWVEQWLGAVPAE